LDALEVAVRRAGEISAVPFVHARHLNALCILCFIFIDSHIALVVVACADQPAENACRVLWIGVVWIEDSGIIVLTIQRRDVVPRDGARGGFTSFYAGPALDAGEEPFNPWAVTLDTIPAPAHRAKRKRLTLPLPADFNELWHQILSVR